jgi:hypothetical protein
MMFTWLLPAIRATSLRQRDRQARPNMRLPQPLQRIVAEDSVLAAWDRRRRHEMALTIAIRRELPRQLAARVRVVDAQHTTLELVADSGAVAAAVRQRLPAVVAKLARDGNEFTGIRVRVQVRTDAEPIQKTTCNQLDKRAADALAAFAGSLRAGPLKTAFEKLLKRHR